MAYLNNCGYTEFTTDTYKYSINVTGNGDGKFNMLIKGCRTAAMIDTQLYLSFFLNAYASRTEVAPFDSFSYEDLVNVNTPLNEWVILADEDIDVNYGVGRFHYTPNELRLKTESYSGHTQGVLPESICNFNSDWEGPGLINVQIYHVLDDYYLSERTNYIGYGDEPPEVSSLANNYGTLRFSYGKVAGVEVDYVYAGDTELTIYYQPKGNYWFTDKLIIDISNDMQKTQWTSGERKLVYPQLDADGQNPIFLQGMKIYKFTTNIGKEFYYQVAMYPDIVPVQFTNIQPKIYLTDSLNNFDYINGKPANIIEEDTSSISYVNKDLNGTYYIVVVPPYTDRVLWMNYQIWQHTVSDSPYEVRLIADPELSYKDDELVASNNFDNFNLIIREHETLRLCYTLPYNVTSLSLQGFPDMFNGHFKVFLENEWSNIDETTGYPLNPLYTEDNVTWSASFDLTDAQGRRGNKIILSIIYIPRDQYSREAGDIGGVFIRPTFKGDYTKRIIVNDVYKEGSSYQTFSQTYCNSRCNNASSYTGRYETYFYSWGCTATQGEPVILYARGLNDYTKQYRVKFLGWSTSPNGAILQDSAVPMYTIYPTSASEQNYYAIYEYTPEDFDWSNDIDIDELFKIYADDWNLLTNRILFSTGNIGSMFHANRYDREEWDADNYFFVKVDDPVSADAYNHLARTLNYRTGSNIADIEPDELLYADKLNLLKDTFNTYINRYSEE